MQLQKSAGGQSYTVFIDYSHQLIKLLKSDAVISGLSENSKVNSNSNFLHFSFSLQSCLKLPIFEVYSKI